MKSNRCTGAPGYLAFFLAMLFIPQLAAETAHSPVVEILESTATRIVFSVRPFQVAFQTKTVDGVLYALPSIPGYSLSQSPGKPQLPRHGLLVGIPENAVPSIELVSLQTSQLPRQRIHPAPALELTGDSRPGYLTEKFTIDEGLFSTDAYYPHEAVSISSIGYVRGQRIARVEFFPIQYNPVSDDLLKIESLTFAVHFNAPNASRAVTPPTSAKSDPFDEISSALLTNYPIARHWKIPAEAMWPVRADAKNSVDWYDPDNTYYKLIVSQTAMCRLDGAYLANHGVDVGAADPRMIKIFNRGIEIPLFVKGEDDGVFDADDCIIFYGERNVGDSTYYDLYSDDNVYWLTWDETPGLRMVARASAAASQQEARVYIENVYLEEDRVFHEGDNSVATLTTDEVESEGWVWCFLYGGDSQVAHFTASEIADSALNCAMTVKLHGTTRDPVFPDHHVQIILNDQVLDDVYLDNTETVLYRQPFDQSLLREGENKIEVKSVGDTGAKLDQIYLDRIELDYPRRLFAENGQLEFTFSPAAPTTARFELWKFHSPNLLLFDMENQAIIQPESLAPGIKISLKVRSAGFDDGNYIDMHINGAWVFGNQSRGHNLMVLDERTGQVIDTRGYDTNGVPEAADSLAAYIQRIPMGRLVLVGIMDEGASLINEAAYLALESLGSALARSVKFRDSWALIGRKGAAIGSVPEKLSPTGTGPVELTSVQILPGDGTDYYVAFNDSLVKERTYLTVSEDSMRQPDALELARPFHLRETEPGADYIIITHENFLSGAHALSQYRSEHNGLRTQVILIDDVYDEFNDGIVHPQAVKDFLHYAYTHWRAPAPTYLVLFGDASWDFKKNSGETAKENFVPSYGSPVSDNWYVCFDGPDDFLPEMIVGRIPVETPDQADIILDKIFTYESAPSAAWKKDVLFITGGFNAGEQATFMAQANTMIQKYITVPPSLCHPFQINKLTTGYIAGEKSQEIIHEFETGKLWINFLGHAGSNTWDLMFDHENIDELTNKDKYPIITSMTCHTGRFANPDLTSFGEHFIFADDKGAVAFWGTTGWGYVFQDNILLSHLFETTMLDTSHFMGVATTYAKYKLWEELGPSVYNNNIIHQYTLLGDPLLDLALPEKPDVTVQAEDLVFSSPSPSESDSSLNVRATIQNWGLAVPDSYFVEIFDHFENTSSLLLRAALPPESTLTSQVDFDWRLAGKAGPHRLQVVADPDNTIDEASEANNSYESSIYIYSSKVSVSRPFENQLLNSSSVTFQVNNPFENGSGASRVYEFEIDTTTLFQSPMLRSLSAIPQGDLVTKWNLSDLLDRTAYFWRCRIQADETVGDWTSSSFLTDFSSQGTVWRESVPAQFLNNQIINATTSAQGVMLKRQSFALWVESAGFSDGNYARIFVNSAPVLENHRGHNLVILSPVTGQVTHMKAFDTFESADAAEAMADFIAAAPTGSYVLSAIQDEGSGSMTEAAYQALESIGSQNCRDVAFRDSWAIIGKKGAAIGSVVEKHTLSGQGPAVVQDTLMNYCTTGSMTSSVIGPSNGWQAVVLDVEKPAASSSLSLDVLGFNKTTSIWDTLLVGNSDPTVDLSSIDARIHSTIRLRANLVAPDGMNTPALKQWSVSYVPVADPAIAPEAISFSADSVLVGEALQVAVNVHNVGMDDVDSALCRLSSTLVNGTAPEAPQEKYAALTPVDSFRTVHFTWNAPSLPGRYALMIEIDPKNVVNELSEMNNYFSREIQVRPDTTDPRLDITYDGKRIRDGDFIACRPTIVIHVFDNSSLPFKDDTTRVRLVLDDAPVSYAGAQSPLTVLAVPRDSDSTLKTQIRFNPELADGSHVLELFIQDASDNLIYERDEFRVASELRLVDVLNYPNPFSDHTDFTFFLTRNADRLGIKIYTIAGRLIRTMEEFYLEPGFCQIHWDGRDQDGDPIANGVYLYKVIARNNSEQVEALGKLVMMK